MTIFGAIPNHIQLKIYKCLIMISSQIKHIYISLTLPWLTTTLAFKFLGDVSVCQWPSNVNITTIGWVFDLLLTLGSSFQKQIRSKESSTMR